MTNRVTNNSIVVSKRTVRKEGGIVILPLKKYEELRERAAPTYYLEGKEAEKLDKLVEEGLEDYRNGKTIKAPSLKEALEIYGRKQNKKH